MVFGKELVLKGVASLAAVGSLGLGVYYNQDLIFGDKSGDALLKRAGLTCQGNNGCSLETNKKLTIRHANGSNSEVEITTLTTSENQKLVLYRGNQYGSYNKNMKFLVEKGDITLTTTANSSSITKLEQFETYELKEEDDANAQGGKKYILLRKTEAKAEIKKELGIPTSGDCDLPTDTTNSKNCNDIDATALKAINFEGKTDSLPSIDNGKKAKLTISKLTDQSADFPGNYKFVLESPSGTGGNITIPTSSSSSSFSIKEGEKVELKIKTNEDKFYLGRAWDIASLIKKIGLKDCSTSGSVCAFDTQGLNLKQDSATYDNKSKTDPQPDGSTGKIKVYTGEEASGYNEGFKFVIEEGDISLNNGNTTPKLEEFETYEITESSNKYYLTRKEKSSEAKRRLLGIPGESNCNFPTNGAEATCTLTVDKLKAIKFEDKGTGDITVDSTGNLKLKISKTTDTNKADYPLGYKFVLESDKEITFTNGNKTIKANTDTEFKIKKGTDNKTLTLERAWTVTALAKKVGLTCTEEDKTCTLTDGQIKLYNSDSQKTENGTKATNGGTDKKISYEENADGHSQGFKFTTSEDITLNGGTNLKIEASNATYEIKEQTSAGTKSWYLSKKTSSAS